MSRTTCGFLAAGLVAVSLPILAMTTVGARAAPLSGAAQDSAIDTTADTPTDFSSARGGGGRGGGGFGGGGRGGGGFGGGRGGGGFGGGRHVSGGRTGGGRTGSARTGGSRTGSARTGGSRTGGSRTGSRTGGSRTGGSRTGGSRTGTARTGGSRTGTARTGGARTGTARTGGARTGTGGARTGTGGARTGGARVGGARVGGARVGGGRVGGVTRIGARRVTTFTGRRFWWGGGWHTLIGIGLLTPWVVDGIDYIPEGYLAYPEPVCTGYTEDGCALRWQDVGTDDGSTIPQCVQFCPRSRRGPPQGAALAPAPLAAGQRKGCEVEVFSDKNLQGTSFKTTDDQPLLNDQWDKQISSINVISGTWDFSTEPQFNGDAMRLEPGSYRDLGPNWDDQISSFMCAK
jgi:beta/gamma crystallin